MVGFKLTPDILKSIMEPLKHSYTNMKLIHDVIYGKRVMYQKRDWPELAMMKPYMKP